MKMFWCCMPCDVNWSPVLWADAEGSPAPECGQCKRPCVMRRGCDHCEGTGYVEATQWNPPNDGPCFECRGTGLRAGQFPPSVEG